MKDARREAVRRALDAVRAGCDLQARRAADPVGFVHRYRDPTDRELVGLAAACIAFGNVRTIRAKLEDLLARIGPSPHRAASDARALRSRLDGWKHRVFLGEDVARLLAGARAVQREHGSLGEAFRAELALADATFTEPLEAFRVALGAFTAAIRKAGGLARGGPRRGPAHLLPDASGTSGNKRLLLFLRWMVRPSDGIDLGQWKVPASRLLIPVDVHIHKLARNLGLTRRADLSWRTTVEITRALAAFDPQDPVKYDFSLCHMGMLQRCASRADPARCEGCAVMPVCVHWTRTRGHATPMRQTSRSDAPARGSSRPGPRTGQDRRRVR
jgi:uncharacterized protein (TIGR02757 family)